MYIPPLTLTLSTSSSMILIIARATTENASLISNMAISSFVSSQAESTFDMAATGAVGKSMGAKAASANPLERESVCLSNITDGHTESLSKETPPKTSKKTQMVEKHSPTILARGFTPLVLAAASVMRTRAAAPSLRVLALAAVMVPSGSGLKAGLRPGNFVKSALV